MNGITQGKAPEPIKAGTVVAKFTLYRQPKQTIKLPLCDDPMHRPRLMKIQLSTVGGDSAVLNVKGMHPVLYCTIPNKPNAKVALVDIYCIKDGEMVPEGTAYIDTVFLGNIAYHFFS